MPNRTGQASLGLKFFFEFLFATENFGFYKKKTQDKVKFQKRMIAVRSRRQCASSSSSSCKGVICGTKSCPGRMYSSFCVHLTIIVSPTVHFGNGARPVTVNMLLGGWSIPRSLPSKGFWGPSYRRRYYERSCRQTAPAPLP